MIILPFDTNILVANGKNAIFGECKWRSGPADLAILRDLKRRSELFSRFEKKYYYLFSKTGFTSGVIKAAEEDSSIRLITLADIYNH
jgi:hypothetical protein